VKLLVVTVGSADDIDESFARAEGANADALLVNSDAVFTNNRQLVIALAARHRIPAMYPIRYAAAGGLISYRTSYADAYRQVGELVARVLKGDRPGNPPVQQVTKVEPVINTKTATTLGLAIPLAFLGRADEVIE
jgi:ABC-type uncharacterized transport system substrate-binding protein